MCSFVVITISGFVPMLFSLTGNLFGMATTLLRTKALFSWGQGYGLTVYFILRAGGDVKAVLLLDGLFNLYGPFLISTLVTYCTGLADTDCIYVYRSNIFVKDIYCYIFL